VPDDVDFCHLGQMGRILAEILFVKKFSGGFGRDITIGKEMASSTLVTDFKKQTGRLRLIHNTLENNTWSFEIIRILKL
jgi:hypothetical protein